MVALMFGAEMLKQGHVEPSGMFTSKDELLAAVNAKYQEPPLVCGLCGERHEPCANPK